MSHTNNQGIDLGEILAAIDEAQRQNRYNESSFAMGATVARLKCLADEYRARQAAPEAPTYELSGSELKRLHRILSLIGVAGAEELDTETSLACLWSLMGELIRKLEAAPVTQQAGAPDVPAHYRKVLAMPDGPDVVSPPPKVCRVCGSLLGTLHALNCTHGTSTVIERDCRTPAATTASTSQSEIIDIAAAIFDFKPHKQTEETKDKYLRFADAVLATGRAPAPSQEAAPLQDWRVGEFWSSARPGEKVLMLARGIDIENFGRHKDFIRWVGAAQAVHAGAADDLRAAGWAVAVHNDYRLNGEAHTFWLFTKDGRAVKGEGKTDAEALEQVRAAIASNAADQGEKK